MQFFGTAVDPRRRNSRGRRLSTKQCFSQGFCSRTLVNWRGNADLSFDLRRGGSSRWDFEFLGDSVNGSRLFDRAEWSFNDLGWLREHFWRYDIVGLAPRLWSWALNSIDNHWRR